MKIVLAPDSYKGSLSAAEVCHILTEEIHGVDGNIEVVSMPLSDGGEGLVDCLGQALGGEIFPCQVQDPMGRPVTARYLMTSEGTAIIEMAAASGLPLLAPEELNPMETSSYGTGELILDALKRGCRQIIMGIGGSATIDGGMGMASALGLCFVDGEGNRLKGCGADLMRVMGVEGSLPKALSEVPITIACDVDNPLCGPRGAAAVFGPQKGADPEMIDYLDRGLAHFSQMMEGLVREGLQQEELQSIKGMGAAGGIALPLYALEGAVLRGGLDIILDVLDFDGCIAGSQYIITGEGRTDAQSAMGKVVSGVARRGKAQGIPVIALSGAVEPGIEALYEIGLTAAFATCTNTRELEWQMTHAGDNLRRAARNILSLIMV
ncbi:glycerate kinase [Eubacterium barkeri]|uniref:Glycerate kinase n=1 Tax=Eubacterium barkeri TaxID=1528 RepID=A0A1H3CAA7_EUBBA|nr:glycerate kinase [Eubacterium barkeri]SDX50828.1 glycerate kinase [Eubacterium barkeri]